MIVGVYIIGLVIAFILKFKASTFILREKVYGLFLLWLSRIMTAAVIILISFDIKKDLGVYAMGTILIYWLVKTLTELRLYRKKLA